MIRGTTPTITYNFPFEVDSIEKFRMYFVQGKNVVLTKTEEECTFSGTTVSAILTQEETYAFSTKKLLQTKARFLLEDGSVCGTKAKNIKVEGDDDSGSEVLALDEVL